MYENEKDVYIKNLTKHECEYWNDHLIYYRNTLEEAQNIFEASLPIIETPKGVHKYFITFTLSPENSSKDQEMVKCVHKLVSSKMFNIVFHDWNKELTKAGVAHVHLYVECNKYIKLDHIRKFYKLGFVKIEKVKHADACLAYCIKERGENE